MTARRRRKRPEPPLPGYSDESPAHRLLGRAFAKLGHERAPAYPGDKKDQNLTRERLDPFEEHEREMQQLQAKERAQKAAEKKKPEKKDKEKKGPKPEDFYFSP